MAIVKCSQSESEVYQLLKEINSMQFKKERMLQKKMTTLKKKKKELLLILS